MTVEEFIDDNRAAIDEAIQGLCPNIGDLDDDERELWLLNDEGLYNWAQEMGVDI